LLTHTNTIVVDFDSPPSILDKPIGQRCDSLDETDFCTPRKSSGNKRESPSEKSERMKRVRRTAPRSSIEIEPPPSLSFSQSNEPIVVLSNHSPNAATLDSSSSFSRPTSSSAHVSNYVALSPVKAVPLSELCSMNGPVVNSSSFNILIENEKQKLASLREEYRSIVDENQATKLLVENQIVVNQTLQYSSMTLNEEAILLQQENKQAQGKLSELKTSYNRASDKFRIISEEIESSKQAQAKLDLLRSQYAWLTGTPGECWSEDLSAYVIHMVLVMMVFFGWSKTKACKAMSKTGHGYNVVMQRVTFWWNNSRMLIVDGATRGWGSSRMQGRRTNFTDDDIDSIRIEVQKRVSRGETVTARKMQLWLNLELHKPLSIRAIRYWFGRFLIWDKGEEFPAIDPDFQNSRIAKFALRYSYALRKQNRTHVPVYTDESYVHNNHAVGFSWFAGLDCFFKRAGLKGRLIILHAMTKDGLLTMKRTISDHDLKVARETAEYVYSIDSKSLNGETESAKETYHGNINSILWLKWLNQRLIPAFKARYPGKQMILIMDGASYHMPRTVDWVPPHKMKREQLVAAYRTYGITEFRFERRYMKNNVEIVRNMHFVEADWNGNSKGSRDSNKPLVGELKKNLSLFLKHNPHLVQRQSITSQTLKEKIGESSYVLLTPPMEPNCQPIELLWGCVKNKIADRYLNGRTVTETRKQCMEGFYGIGCGDVDILSYSIVDGDWEAGIMKAECASYINHCIEWLNNWIAEHNELLEGTVDGEEDLSYTSDMFDDQVDWEEEQEEMLILQEEEDYEREEGEEEEADVETELDSDDELLSSEFARRQG
jgi:hypothetical protein